MKTKCENVHLTSLLMCQMRESAQLVRENIYSNASGREGNELLLVKNKIKSRQTCVYICVCVCVLQSDYTSDAFYAYIETKGSTF